MESSRKQLSESRRENVQRRTEKKRARVWNGGEV